jgi:hypothetical protein
VLPVFPGSNFEINTTGPTWYRPAWRIFDSPNVLTQRQHAPWVDTPKKKAPRNKVASSGIVDTAERLRHNLLLFLRIKIAIVITRLQNHRFF